MSDDNDPSGSVRDPEVVASSSGCVVRLLWLLVGPVAFVLGSGLLADRGRSSTLAGYLFVWGAALSMVALRYLDVAHFDGLRSDGKPSTMSDFRRYAVRVLALAALLSGMAFWWRS